MKDFDDVIKNISGKIDLIKIRYKYKDRKNISLSDDEFDSLIEETKYNVVGLIVLNHFAIDKLKELDLANKKVQRGKEKSLYSTVMESVNAFIQAKGEESGKDKHN